ncbi:hypothetical protein H2201_004380 [Coniosporium apollinis]|uniref:Helicase ATP-binding domain-containing protein n=1 Tax=Coniosporium apollinis TaxID=61459 RepID=A0ABQ9NY39_9PEZI|nr:hypothetical protein H2201_004380 [Coniosporium apollinis]
MGAGFTLCWARRPFMLERLWVMRDEPHETGCVNRAKVVQMNKCTSSYRFIMESLAVKQKIMSRQMARDGIQRATYNGGEADDEEGPAAIVEWAPSFSYTKHLQRGADSLTVVLCTSFDLRPLLEQLTSDIWSGTQRVSKEEPIGAHNAANYDWEKKTKGTVKKVIRTQQSRDAAGDNAINEADKDVGSDLEDGPNEVAPPTLASALSGRFSIVVLDEGYKAKDMLSQTRASISHSHTRKHFIISATPIVNLLNFKIVEELIKGFYDQLEPGNLDVLNPEPFEKLLSLDTLGSATAPKAFPEIFQCIFLKRTAASIITRPDEF